MPQRRSGRSRRRCCPTTGPVSAPPSRTRPAADDGPPPAGRPSWLRTLVGAGRRVGNRHDSGLGCSAWLRSTWNRPTEASIRRALRRAADGKAIDADEAAALLAARGEQLDELLAVAAGIRDAGLREAGRPGVVTYSRKVFIPLTRLCRDRCHYCTFATVPHRLPAAFLERDEVLEIAREGAAQGCKEALFTLGDRPEERWPAARQWLDERGYDSTLDYVRACAIAVLEETGLLPHLNPGVLSWAELQRLKPVAPSMGMMLETTATRLWSEPGGPHYGSPDKEPRGPAAGARRRRPGRRAVHHRHPDRHRRDPGRAGRLALRDAPHGPRVRAHPGGHHPELPRQAGHGDARDARRRAARAGRDGGGGPDHHGPAGPDPGAAQPDRRRVRRCCCGPASTTGAACRR